MANYASGIMNIGADISDRQGNMGALQSAAILSEVESESIMSAAKFNAQQQEKQGAKFVSRQIAAYAKAGVKFEGSPAIVYANTVRDLSMDRAINHANAVNQAIAKGWEANNLRMRAKFEKANQWGDVSRGLLSMASSSALQTNASK